MTVQTTQAYGLTVKLNAPFEEAVAQVTAALKTQGFGILTEIDVQATLKKKLDVDSDRYMILGACNPPLAHRALQADPQVGLLLPCNVIVYQPDSADETTVSLVDPLAMMQVTDNAALTEVAQEALGRLQKVVEVLEA